ncbi:hypothetical protein SK854_47770 [Lentzea sp. BCCO 10_0061]|uniref:Uncharacterized protein n=1 Tax=Lentzea sokolovensis TaxID=3095429 RepID=A0ABU4VDL2_9PSEU|nr:hypothetical protein [Lentzea sp. BCCO 10_0061]MDX8149888.1 hypothetical protein [Lentzea sp. BCCO 10_0061]
MQQELTPIALATGHRPDLPYLSLLGTDHDRGVSRKHRGLGFVGLEWQRSLLGDYARCQP